MMELFELFIISFPNSRWTLWEAKQTKDIVSKCFKQSMQTKQFQGHSSSWLTGHDICI